MKSKVGIADAFGTLVEVGDTVVYKGKQKYLEKGQVTIVTGKHYVYRDWETLRLS